MRKLTSISIVIVLNIFGLVNGANFQKCCKFDEHIKKNSSKYLCQKNPSKRLEINLKQSDINQEQNITSICIDEYEEELTQFVISTVRGIVEKQKVLEEDYFPKCCPSTYIYDSSTHSCTKTNTSKNSFAREHYLKIGLPKCTIIMDYKIPTLVNVITDRKQIIIPELNRTFMAGKYCIDDDVNLDYVVRHCEESLDICKKIKCLHKCCQDGQSFVNRSNCEDTFTHGLDLKSVQPENRIENIEDPFAIIHGKPKMAYILDKTNLYVLKPDGVLQVYNNLSKEYTEIPSDSDKYCIEHAFTQDRLNNSLFFHKYEGQTVPLKFEVTKWVKIVSCFFLILTIAVYLSIPEMRSGFGKILISYCVATFFCFLLLSYVQFYNTSNAALCYTFGLLIHLFNFSTFTWWNIMAVDIWCAFGSSKASFGNRNGGYKKFIYYSLYGWGAPLAMNVLVIIFNRTNILPEVIHPYIGEKRCFFDPEHNGKQIYAETLFMIIPIAIMLTINIILFIKTIRYCLKVKSEINRMNDTARSESNRKLQADKEKLNLIIKLSVIMGVSFIFEIVSAFFDLSRYTTTEYIEVVWDTINCLQGLFIFIIFICKPKVMKALAKKLHLKLRRSSMSSTTTTQMQMYVANGAKSDKTQRDSPAKYN